MGGGGTPKGQIKKGGVGWGGAMNPSVHTSTHKHAGRGAKRHQIHCQIGKGKIDMRTD